VVDVVQEADRHTPLLRREQGGEDEPARVGLEADVVQGEVEARSGLRDECGGLLGDVEGRLAAVGQERQLDRPAAFRSAAQRARSDAL
jgi:hypothetical protein